MITKLSIANFKSIRQLDLDCKKINLFIATHNPYLLSAILEKGRKEDARVFITYFKDYQTKVKSLTSDELSELMEGDPFLNLGRFTEELCPCGTIT